MIREAFLSSDAVVVGLLREPVLAERWGGPSALADFSVGGLARHLANQVTHTVAVVASAPGGVAIPVLEHFTRNTWVTSGVGGADNVGIRRRAEAAVAASTAA